MALVREPQTLTHIKDVLKLKMNCHELSAACMWPS